MNIGERLTAIMRSKRLTQKELGEIGNKSDVAIGNIINKGVEPKFGLLSAIVKRFPDISSRWMLTGEGELESPELTFENKIELLRYLVDNQEEFKKFESFNLLLNDISEVSEFQLMKNQLNKLSRDVASIRKKI